MSRNEKLPLVYSCSGASSAAQMANHIAVKLDRLKVAEMSCIAGVGGDVKPLVRMAKSRRPIITLDGCPLQCAAQILQRHGIIADKHYDLGEMGVQKKLHEDFDPAEAMRLLQVIVKDARLGPPTASPDPPRFARAIPISASAAGVTRPASPPGFPGATGDEATGPTSPDCGLKGIKDS